MSFDLAELLGEQIDIEGSEMKYWLIASQHRHGSRVGGHYWSTVWSPESQQFILLDDQRAPKTVSLRELVQEHLDGRGSPPRAWKNCRTTLRQNGDHSVFSFKSAPEPWLSDFVLPSVNVCSVTYMRADLCRMGSLERPLRLARSANEERDDATTNFFSALECSAYSFVLAPSSLLMEWAQGGDIDKQQLIAAVQKLRCTHGRLAPASSTDTKAIGANALEVLAQYFDVRSSRIGFLIDLRAGSVSDSGMCPDCVAALRSPAASAPTDAARHLQPAAESSARRGAPQPTPGSSSAPGALEVGTVFRDINHMYATVAAWEDHEGFRAVVAMTKYRHKQTKARAPRQVNELGIPTEPLTRIAFACNRSGKPRVTKKVQTGGRPGRKSHRVGCTWRLNLRGEEDGSFRVVGVCTKHANHTLSRELM
jgi:hypothetical protein